VWLGIGLKITGFGSGAAGAPADPGGIEDVLLLENGFSVLLEDETSFALLEGGGADPDDVIDILLLESQSGSGFLMEDGTSLILLESDVFALTADDNVVVLTADDGITILTAD
jgi:hypothetical protein